MIINANIWSGEEELLKLTSILDEMGYKTPLYLIDKNLFEKSEYISDYIKSVKVDKMLMIYDHPFEPSYQMLDKMMDYARNKKIFGNVDVIVGIGGGSVLDTAKGLAILFKNSGEAIKYKGFPSNLEHPLPVIAIPSTTGTGSEVVYNASFIDEDTKVKMGINYKYNYPAVAILDPIIPSKAPIRVLASSGCDALVHTLEAFMSIKSNSQVKFFSKRAYNLIIENMVPILKGNGQLKHWSNMQWAAVYAMFALSNSTSGPTGALSYFLGANYNVNHGLAGGVFIGKVCKYNHENGYFDLGDLLMENHKNSFKPEKRSAIVLAQIEELLSLAEIPKSLSVFGVNEDSFKGFQDFSIKAKEAFSYNPIKIDLDQVSNYFINID